MKKMLLLLAAMLLAVMPLTGAFAEAEAVPAQIVPQASGLLTMADAIAKAEATLEVLPDNCQTRAELVRMTDDNRVWVVSIFDLTNFTDAWSVAVDATTGAVLTKDITKVGFFDGVHDRWVAAKGVEALWPLEDKLLYDTLYSVSPTYGMPAIGDMNQGEALMKALEALDLNSTEGLEIGYGYIAGSTDGAINGMWEVYFVQDDEMAYKVNLDAVSGEVYFIEPDEEGNG